MHTRMTVSTPDEMLRLGRSLATLLRPGDLVLLDGELGAGKTTLTRGLGDGLGVRGPVASPTFVIARVHPSLGAGPALVHVDAYRLGGLAELDDLDLDADLAEVVTVVEWGQDMAEVLAEERLEITLTRMEEGPRPDGAPGEQDGIPTDADQPRAVRATGHGARWTEGDRL